MHIAIPGVKKIYEGLMRPLSELFHLKFHLQPNHVSCIGFVIGLVSVVLVFTGSWQIGLLVMAFSLFLDGVDGNIARTYGLQSKTGEKMELVFDRSLELLLFLAIGYIFKINLIVVLLAFYSIILVTTLREKTRFDPGFKRISLLFGFIISFEIILNIVFLIHICSFLLQMIITEYNPVPS